MNEESRLNKFVSNKEFYSYISDLINNNSVLQLKSFTHHYFTTCYDHSIRVAYHNFIICKLLGLNAKAASRGGLLHDLYLYNRKTYVRSKGEKLHGFRHPHIALDNASKLFRLTKIEKDIIVKHMFPLTLKFPKYPESYITTITDKYLCVAEITEGLFKVAFNGLNKFAYN